MPLNDFMNKVRYLDNKMAKWMIRHFYILFFEILLVIVFFLFFVNTIKVIDLNFDISRESLTERLLLVQALNTLFILFLLLLNSFWMLYIFRGVIRSQSILREINFNISRLGRKPFKNTPGTTP